MAYPYYGQGTQGVVVAPPVYATTVSVVSNNNSNNAQTAYSTATTTYSYSNNNATAPVYASATVVAPPPPQTLGSSGQIILAQALSDSEGDAVPAAEVVYEAPTSTATAGVQSQQQQQQPTAYYGENTLQGRYARYDELTRLIQRLGDTTGSRQQGERNLESVQKAYKDNNTALEKNRASQPRAERRLHRNAHPRFLHYLQFNREEKVKRLESELQALRDDERKRDELKRQYEADIQKRQQELASLKSAEAQTKSAEAEKLQIFEYIVSSQPPTQLLLGLRQNLATVEADANTDAFLLNAVQNSLNQIHGARQLFAQAHRDLKQAVGMNMGAGFVNMGQAVRRGPDNMGGQFAERAMQMRRDHLLNEARMVALRAGDQLQRAFDSFPMEARVRFPQLTANICNAPIPNLRGANFFGTVAVGWVGGNFGDAMNDMYAQRKINQNIQVLAQCEQIAAGQAQAVQQVMNYIDATVKSLQAECSRLRSAIQAERVVIFDTTRRMVTMPQSIYNTPTVQNVQPVQATSWW